MKENKEEKDLTFNMVNIPLMYITNDKDMYSVNVMKIEHMKIVPYEKDANLHIYFDSGNELKIKFDDKDNAVDCHNNIIRMSEQYITSRMSE